MNAVEASKVGLGIQLSGNRRKRLTSDKSYGGSIGRVFLMISRGYPKRSLTYRTISPGRNIGRYLYGVLYLTILTYTYYFNRVDRSIKESPW